MSKTHLPLRSTFPAHTVAAFTGKLHSELSDACHQLVATYYAKVGLPSGPSIPKRGALPGFGVIRGVGPAPRLPKGELRVALLGVAPGDRLFFEFALFPSERDVATEATLQQYTVDTRSKNENAPPPSKWIPTSAMKAMERLEGRALRLERPPANPRGKGTVMLGELRELGLSGSLAKFGARPMFAMPSSVDEKLALLDRLPEGDFPSTAASSLMAKVESYVEGKRADSISALVGAQTLGEGVCHGFHATASLEQVVTYVVGRSYEVIGFPR